MPEVSSLMNRNCTNKLNATKLNKKIKENDVKYRLTWDGKKEKKKCFIYVSTAQKAETSFVFMFTAIKSRGAEK